MMLMCGDGSTAAGSWLAAAPSGAPLPLVATSSAERAPATGDACTQPAGAQQRCDDEPSSEAEKDLVVTSRIARVLVGDLLPLLEDDTRQVKINGRCALIFILHELLVSLKLKILAENSVLINFG
jgi:hypothetical protein